MNDKLRRCPDCDSFEMPAHESPVSRREFLRVAGAAAAVTAGLPSLAHAAETAAAKPTGSPETLVKTLFNALSDEQKKAVCFDWDYVHPKMGLLRTRVANNWHITDPEINGKFYTADQRDIVRAIFEGLIQPDWHKRIDQQLDDDAGGFGEDQNIAIFGKPGDMDKFEFVMTGRHLTCRADGHSQSHVALGGPVFHGHAASGFNEKVHHPGNVFWPQALLANKVYEILDEKQKKTALLPKRPAEAAVSFRGKDQDAKYPGLPISDMTSDQRAAVQKVLLSLLEPYRKEDQEEVMECLKKQGGLEKCSLAFYQDGDLGDDGEWDNWRLEGPSFVWYFRGHPHVHIWINVADDASVATNARG